MTPQRAQYILDHRLMGGDLRFSFHEKYWSQYKLYPDGITETEHQAILALWKTMPGNTSYTDAVRRIAKSGTES